MAEPLKDFSNRLKYHQDHLIRLYTALGHSDPEALVSTKISELHVGILKTIDLQAKQAEDEVSNLTSKLEELSSNIKSLRHILNHHANHHLDLEPLNGTEHLVPRLERLQLIESDLINLKLDREIQSENWITKLEAFAPILGEKATSIINPGTDLSTDYIKRLENHHQSCQSEIRQRSETLLQHLQAIFNLWADLGVSVNLDEKSDQAQDFDQQVLQHFGFTSVQVTLQSQITPSGSLTPHALLPTTSNLDRASFRQAELEAEASRRGQEIQDCYDQLCPIWTSLGVSEEEQEQFVESWSGLHVECLDAYRNELFRMKEQRNLHMVIFIQEKREEIVKLWDSLYVPTTDREGVEIMNSGDYSEELLTAHELKHQELIEELIDKKPVLAILERYFKLLQEQKELQAAEKDPDRFAKGKRGQPGKLLQEEKTRKKIAKEKPKLEADLQKLIPAWENARGRPFLINGSRFLDDLVSRLEQETVQKSKPSASIKRQQTGPPSRTASPVKRIRSGIATALRSKPPVAMRGNVNPFGSSTTVTPADPPRSSRSNNMRLAPQPTGSSISGYYNPATPTPASHAALSATYSLRPASIVHRPPPSSRAPSVARSASNCRSTSHGPSACHLSGQHPSDTQQLHAGSGGGHNATMLALQASADQVVRPIHDVQPVTHPLTFSSVHHPLPSRPSHFSDALASALQEPAETDPPILVPLLRAHVPVARVPEDPSGAAPQHVMPQPPQPLPLDLKSSGADGALAERPLNVVPPHPSIRVKQVAIPRKSAFRPRPSSVLPSAAAAVVPSRTVSISGSTNTVDSAQGILLNTHES